MIISDCEFDKDIENGEVEFSVLPDGSVEAREVCEDCYSPETSEARVCVVGESGEVSTIPTDTLRCNRVPLCDSIWLIAIITAAAAVLFVVVLLILCLIICCIPLYRKHRGFKHEYHPQGEFLTSF